MKQHLKDLQNSLQCIFITLNKLRDSFYYYYDSENITTYDIQNLMEFMEFIIGDTNVAIDQILTIEELMIVIVTEMFGYSKETPENYRIDFMTLEELKAYDLKDWNSYVALGFDDDEAIRLLQEKLGTQNGFPLNAESELMELAARLCWPYFFSEIKKRLIYTKENNL